MLSQQKHKMILSIFSLTEIHIFSRKKHLIEKIEIITSIVTQT